jgi:hypothetical protein
MPDHPVHTRIPVAARGPRPGAPPLAGATLFYPSTGTRPDLFLTAQILIEDLRAEGWQMSGLRISDQMLRLRLAGMELALARSDRPLPPDSLRGLCRPLQRLAANCDHRPAEPEPDLWDPAGPDTPEGPGAERADPPLTDLGQVRVTRALRQHQAALGVLLRRRGTQGPDDLDAALLTILRAVAEAAPPALVMVQRTGVVMTPAEFAACDAADLARPGDPARPILPGPTRPRPLSAPEGRMPTPPAPVGAEQLGRQARAARRSAGRVFGQAEGGAVVLPRIDTAVAGLSAALRRSAPGDEDGRGAAPHPTTPHQLSVLAVVALWCTLILPGGAGLQAILPL